jgi:hypothetical protein
LDLYGVGERIPTTGGTIAIPDIPDLFVRTPVHRGEFTAKIKRLPDANRIT